MKAVQGSLADLGTPLAEATFTVVDLETTGGSPADCAITEIGAVKVRGGEPAGEFATLVDPGSPIPPFITVLTGITQQMVMAAPRVEAVLPAFLEFVRGTVLVAHNASFDVSFLRAACAAHGHAWPTLTIVDTADLARRVLTRDEVDNCKLSTLARYFRTPDSPCHRALADARATVHVLHGLFERVGCFGVSTVEDLTGFARSPTREQTRKRHLADDVPRGPGVYLFEDERGDILYIGKSTDLRTRVKSYFTASETRPRVREMIGIADRVRTISCAITLEAEVRELRMIAEHKPRYNRRSRFPERALWLKLTDEMFPRLSIVREARDESGVYLGPFGSRRLATEAVAAVHEAIPLRECTQRLTSRLIESGRARTCMLGELGRCGAPCEGRESALEYARHAEDVRRVFAGDVRSVVAAARVRIDRLAGELRYEEAAAQRDRLAAFIRVATRCQRLTALSSIAQLVGARPAFEGGWELAVVRHGRLAASGVMPPGAHPTPYVEALTATAETVRPQGGSPTPCATAEEMECVLRWLESPGTRLVSVTEPWSCPVHGAEGVREWIEAATSSRGSALGRESV